MELYNWYIDALDGIPYICGDVVKIPLRQDEYQDDKLNKTTHKQIVHNDEIFRNKLSKSDRFEWRGEYYGETVRPADRIMQFIREPLKHAIDHETIVSNTKKQQVYWLQNKDSYFEKRKRFIDKCKELGIR
jgi:hypothetical protein